jgi:hypothetical protein
MNKVLVALLICGVLITPGAMAELKVGAAARSITPDPLLPVSGGVGTPDPAKETRGDLNVRALVLDDGETRVAIVSLDLLGFPSVLADRVRKQVPQVPPENIMMGATHTHSAPDCYAFPLPDGGHTGDLAYMDFVCKQAAAAIQDALENARVAHLKIATGEAKGQIAYNYYGPQLYDPRCHVIQAVTPGGEGIATLVNYATHPEVIGDGQGICSPDMVGPLYDRIEAQGGGMGIFMNSAQGGMVTSDNRILDKPRDMLKGYWEDDNSWEECIRIGHLLADEALRIVQDAPVQADPALFCDAESIEFPVTAAMMWFIVQGSPLNYPRNEERKSITSRVNVVNIGNAQIMTIPGEALPNIGFYLKRKMHGEHNLLFGLTNDAFGYILVKEDFNSFARYNYISETSLGEMTGDILVEKGLEFVDRCPRPETLN